MRIFSGLANISTATTITKFFKLTTVTVVMNLTPILTLIVGIIFLKEKAGGIDIACILLSFCGVMCMTYAVI